MKTDKIFELKIPKTTEHEVLVQGKTVGVKATYDGKDVIFPLDPTDQNLYPVKVINTSNGQITNAVATPFLIASAMYDLIAYKAEDGVKIITPNLTENNGKKVLNLTAKARAYQVVNSVASFQDTDITDFNYTVGITIGLLAPALITLQMNSLRDLFTEEVYSLAEKGITLTKDENNNLVFDTNYQFSIQLYGQDLIFNDINGFVHGKIDVL